MASTTAPNKVRFPAPVPVGLAHPRALPRRRRVERRATAACRSRSTATVEREGGDKPVCVAELLFRLLDEDRVALVTGAAGGIGARSSRGSRRRRLRRARRSTSATADLDDARGQPAVVDAALERFGRLDAVVANAGFQHVAPVREFPEERWDALLALLLTSPFLLAKYAWEALAASRRRPLLRRSPRRTGSSPRRSRPATSPRSTACSGS